MNIFNGTFVSASALSFVYYHFASRTGSNKTKSHTQYSNLSVDFKLSRGPYRSARPMLRESKYVYVMYANVYFLLEFMHLLLGEGNGRFVDDRVPGTVRAEYKRGWGGEKG